MILLDNCWDGWSQPISWRMTPRRLLYFLRIGRFACLRFFSTVFSVFDIRLCLVVSWSCLGTIIERFILILYCFASIFFLNNRLAHCFTSACRPLLIGPHYPDYLGLRLFLFYIIELLFIARLRNSIFAWTSRLLSMWVETFPNVWLAYCCTSV